jgi:hypothetical protein
MKGHVCAVLLWCVCLLGFPTAAPAVLTDGLVGYWPLDGLDATDASGNGLDGMINGDVDVAEDRFGRVDGAMLFPGLEGSNVDLGDVQELQLTGSMTLAAWVVLDSFNSNNGRIIAKRGGGGNRSWNLNIESNGAPASFMISSDGSESFSVADPDELPMDEWVHVVGIYRAGESLEVYVNAELKDIIDRDIPDTQFSDNGLPVLIGDRNGCGNCGWLGAIDDVAVWQRDLSPEEVMTLFQNGIGGGTFLMAGDADMDLKFDQLDLVQVQIAAKYLTGQPATWGEGDWDGAPGGTPGDPPTGNGFFDQLDIIAALAAGTYLTGPYAAIHSSPMAGDGPTSMIDHAANDLSAVGPLAGGDFGEIDMLYVPEPTSIVMLACGAMIAFSRRSRRGSWTGRPNGLA